jgi:hypothetical protein
MENDASRMIQPTIAPTTEAATTADEGLVAPILWLKLSLDTVVIVGLVLLTSAITTGSETYTPLESNTTARFDALELISVTESAAEMFDTKNANSAELLMFAYVLAMVIASSGKAIGAQIWIDDADTTDDPGRVCPLIALNLANPILAAANPFERSDVFDTLSKD